MSALVPIVVVTAETLTILAASPFISPSTSAAADVMTTLPATVSSESIINSDPTPVTDTFRAVEPWSSIIRLPRSVKSPVVVNIPAVTDLERILWL